MMDKNRSQVNAYSRTWFELFLETRPFAQSETAFVIRYLSNPPYQRILDVCCGQGRHTNLLAKEGYHMVGVDIDEQALTIARRGANQNVRYIQQDMRRLDQLDESYDAVLCLWQSFGYFDETTNAAILAQMSQMLNPNGRLILDIYNRAFWENNQGRSFFERKGITIAANNRMVGNRLTCELVYGADKGGETFDWQLYTLSEITDLAANKGLKLLLHCVEGDESRGANPNNAQMQLVFEKV
ncbi:MAG: class I SAM-dependent methyltransferase [Chloroflexota bacterium]